MIMDEQAEKFKKNLYELYESGEWRKVLKLGETAALSYRSRYLWAWPSDTGLNDLKRELNGLGIRSLVSIGCGPGLLEWIINKHTSIDIKGLEVDEFYWISQNAPKPFIDLEFARRQISSGFLSTFCANMRDPALLFCYFNNPRAFYDYVRFYRGNYIVIIGPSSQVTDRHTDPSPESPDFGENQEWDKVCTKEFNTNKDVFVIYKRKHLFKG